MPQNFSHLNRNLPIIFNKAFPTVYKILNVYILQFAQIFSKFSTNNFEIDKNFYNSKYSLKFRVKFY